MIIINGLGILRYTIYSRHSDLPCLGRTLRYGPAYTYMTKEFWTTTEILEIFQIDESFLANLEEEEIICPTCQEDSLAKLFPPHELEKLHLAKVLVEDMGVNLAGVEVILGMRSRMIDMRKQFDAILKDLAQHLHEAFKKSPEPR